MSLLRKRAARTHTRTRSTAGRPPAGANGRAVTSYPQLNIRLHPQVLKKFRAQVRRSGLNQTDYFTALVNTPPVVLELDPHLQES